VQGFQLGFDSLDFAGILRPQQNTEYAGDAQASALRRGSPFLLAQEHQIGGHLQRQCNDPGLTRIEGRFQQSGDFVVSECPAV
jgi:hypothetical protein